MNIQLTVSTSNEYIKYCKDNKLSIPDITKEKDKDAFEEFTELIDKILTLDNAIYCLFRSTGGSYGLGVDICSRMKSEYIKEFDEKYGEYQHVNDPFD